MLWLSLDDAVADVRQLLTLLIESHPDPYTNAGGPIGLHRCAAGIFRAIPDDGISRGDLLRLVRPLMASLCDGHTFLFEPGKEPGSQHGAAAPVLPITLDPIDRRLCVTAVHHEEDRELLGGVLEGVEDVPFDDLSSRMARLRGPDNDYTNLVHLADALVDPPLLAELLELEVSPQPVRFRLRTPEGEDRSVELAAEADPGDPIEPPSNVALPSLTASDIGWGFLRDDRSVACLRIASLVRYREAFELSHASGHGRFLETYLADTVQAATGGPPSDDIDAAIASVPSAAEQMETLFGEMRAAGTRTLIVDLRDNGGGNSYFAAILGYFLYGLDGLVDIDWGYQILRYSPLYLANYLSPPEGRRIAIDASLMNGGYDFSEEIAWKRRAGGAGDDRARGLADLQVEIGRTPSFARVMERGEQPGFPLLNVVVLTSARTYSAGFDVAAMLVKGGAALVGVPSSQAGNCFIDSLFFTLEHSGLTGIISHKWSSLFPDDADRGTVLRPDYELTYDYLASVRFDRNAAVALALERYV